MAATATTKINMMAHNLQSVRTATKKAGGSTKNGRDSPGQRLGVKKFGGELVQPGHILIRQRGQKYHCGSNVKLGRDHTIYSVANGWVKFDYNREKKHQVVSVSPVNPNILSRKALEEIAVAAAAAAAASSGGVSAASSTTTGDVSKGEGASSSASKQQQTAH